MTKQRVIVLSDQAVAFRDTPAPVMPVIEDIYSIGGDRAWVVVCTEFQQEEKARKKLEEAKVETYLPIERAYVRKTDVTTTMVAGMIWKTRNKTIRRPVDRPLFPGYLFAQLPLKDATVSAVAAARVHHTEGVVRILGSDRPIPVPDKFISLIRSCQGGGAFDRTSTSWAKEGTRVMISDGPFATFIGVIEECLPKDILKVAVEIFGRQTPVLLDLAQLEKAC